MNAATTALALAEDAPDAFEYWWSVKGEWVEPPNARRDGWSGMLRVRHHGRLVYVKRQCNHLCRTLRHPLGWPTASRERFYLDRLCELGLRSPSPLFHGAIRGGNGVKSLLVTEELAGFLPLSAQTGLPWAQRARLARAVGRVLATLHRARLQHGCLYDKHIMVRWRDDTPEIALIDLEKMRSRLTGRAAARHDLAQLGRHQKIWSAEDWCLLELSHAAALAGNEIDRDLRDHSGDDRRSTRNEHDNKRWLRESGSV